MVGWSDGRRGGEDGPGEEVEGGDAVTAADEQDVRVRRRKGEAAAERSHQVHAVAGRENRHRGGASADFLVEDRQGTGGGVGVADAERPAQRAFFQRRHAQVDELARHGRGRGFRRVQDQHAASGARGAVGQDGCVGTERCVGHGGAC